MLQPDDRAWPRLLVLPAALGAAACEGPQSALSPAGRDAEQVAELFWWMAGGAAVIWLAVIGLTIYAIASRRKHDRKKAQLFIVGAGAIFPVVVLTVLLVFGLRLMPDLLEHGSAEGPQIHVGGKQWWWRVRYEMPDGQTFELANEIRVPVGRRTPLWLASEDVIHSLWVPSLGGKIDMIPGRVNRMAFEPTKTGVFRGVCAEYCGISHARMTLQVVVVEADEFDAWVEAQLAPAREPADEVEKRGAELFAMNGCGACHTVRGTGADGRLGPDLTHVGGRLLVGDVTLANDVEGFRRWLTRTDHVKPGVKMPTFDMLPDGDVRALATYLEGLR